MQLDHHPLKAPHMITKPASIESSNKLNRSVVIIKGLGLLMLALGIFALYAGPLELHTFTAFSEGGRFHYEGFGFGSFMFALIAVQAVGYYGIAALSIPLGLGHWRLRRWALDLALTFLWFWLVAGLPLTVVIYLLFLTSKVTSPVILLVTLPLTLLLYPIGPLLLIRFYQSPSVQGMVDQHDPAPSFLARIPLRVRVACVLLIAYIVLLHGLIIVNGIFPWFGVMLAGKTGVLALDIAIIVLLALTWGLAEGYPLAWWGALIDFSLMAVSSIITFSRFTFRATLEAMAFPPAEMEWFQGIPFLDQYPVWLVALPLVVTLLCLVSVWRDFLKRPEYSMAGHR
jgi:hypothetical protein